MSEEWDWRLTDSAERKFDSLDNYARERVVAKLDEVVKDQWREPDDYLEPLASVPHQKYGSVRSASEVGSVETRRYCGS